MQVQKKVTSLTEPAGRSQEHVFETRDPIEVSQTVHFPRIHSLRGKIRLGGHFVHVEFLLLALVEWFAAVTAFSTLNALVAKADSLFLWSFDSFIYAFLTTLSLTAMGLYDSRQRHSLFEIFVHIVVGLAFSSAAILLINSVYFDSKLSYQYVLFGVAALSMILMVIRTVFSRYLDGFVLRRNVLVLGTGKRAKRIEGLRRKADQRGFNLLGFFPSRGCQHYYVDPQKLLSIDKLCQYALSRNVDEIVIALDDRRQGLPVNDLLDCRMSGIQITEDLDFFERESSMVHLDLIQSGWLIRSQGFGKSYLTHILKRSLDLFGSLILGVIFLPVMILTAVAIKFECGLRSPVFYTQQRVGLAGKLFTIYKFRSMYQNAEADGKAQWAKTGDSRITKVGRIIRKYRIDELPQLWNVIIGDMSLVGPRPERKEFVDSLSHLNEFYSDRHRVAPGLTGWAQLCYPYGAPELDAIEKLKFDLYYIKNQSLLLDVYILIKTAEVVLFKKGAR